MQGNQLTRLSYYTNTGFLCDKKNLPTDLHELWNDRGTLSGHPPVGELKKVGKSRIFWQKVGGFFTKVGKGRIIFSLF